MLSVGFSSSIPCRLEAVEVALPVCGRIAAKFMQISPGIKTGIVAIVEHQAHGVMPHRFDGLDDNVLLAGLQEFLPRSMTLDVGAR